MSKQKENEWANEIDRLTTSGVKAIRCGYSGNSAIAGVPDILITQVVGGPRNDLATTHHIELKHRQADVGKRVTIMSGSSDGSTGYMELNDLCAYTPEYGTAWVWVKIPRRTIFLLNAELLMNDLLLDSSEEYPAFEARLTPSNNISIRIPEDCSSERSSKSIDRIIDTLQLPTK